MKVNQFLKYVDLFGKKCSFYVEKTPKLYSVTGGILSIIAISICFILFIFTSLDDFRRIFPAISISSVQPDGYHKIKFGKEKIWIPWRIRDYSNHYVNHTNIFYPLIYNYYSIKKSFGTGFEFKIKQLNYKLCNETSFINKSEIYYIDSSLDELYCIEMDDIDVGGSWNSEYISYIEFDLYLCKEGIDYDENNPDCTKYENISHYKGENNSLLMSFYYPIVQFKANESINPMTIIYRERFYQISRYTNKIDRLFLQKNIVKDDYGWLINQYNETSYWGLNQIQGDSYTTGNKRDLMNEGSTSRVYSFNIYLEPITNTYLRSYKKIYIILSECIPLIYIVSFLFNLIASFIKFHTINKKFMEYLFVNLKGKSDIFDKKIKELKELNEKTFNRIDNKEFQNHSFKKINNFYSKYNKEIENINLSNQKNNIFQNKIKQPSASEKPEKSENFEKNVNEKNSKFEKFEKFEKDNSIEILNQNVQKEIISNKSNEPNNNKYNIRPTIKSYFGMNKRESSIPNEKMKIKRRSAKRMSLVGNPKVHVNSLFKQMQKNEQHKHFIQRQLFPSRYYFYVIFIKNLDILKKTKCVSKKFSKTYIFLTRLLDISSYLDLLRQFNIFKSYFLNEYHLNTVEKTKKINIGEISFMKNIKECIDNNNFRIFGKKKEDNY